MKKKIKGYGVFCKDYGGLIGFSIDEEMAIKLMRTEFAQVSACRSEDEFNVKPCTITFTLPKKIK